VAAVTREGPERFRPIFERELPYVWSTLRRLGVKPADLEDVVHEVFVRVYRKLAEYDDARPIRPWLFGFAYRGAADYRRLARHRREAPGVDTDAPDPRAGPDEEVDLSDRRALLDRALEAVPLERRAVLVLHELEEKPVPEIADALGIPLNTAYSRLRTGRAELAAALKRATLARST
jgi:RNA polymerase sigma-70 factor, ECF subfamily